MLAISTGCNGLVGTYQISTSLDAGSFQPVGVGFYRYGTEGWRDWTGRTVTPSPMVLSWTDVQIAKSDSALAEVLTRRIPGSLRLLGIEGGRVWLVDARMAPELFTVREERFREWASM